MEQSQKHGFCWENEIRKSVFGLSEESNNTNTHDIPCEKNKYNDIENVSIKTTGSMTIYCADISRFYKYDFEKKNTIIVVNYEQVSNNKVIKKIYEIDYNKECHKLLFGDLPLETINDYITNIKSIPKGHVSKEISEKYLKTKEEIQKKFNPKIIINPKVDHINQRRVQCSIPNFSETLKDFIIYKSDENNPNFIRGEKITKSIKSDKRERKGITKEILKDIARQNKVKRYSALNKHDLSYLLKSLLLI